MAARGTPPAPRTRNMAAPGALHTRAPLLLVPWQAWAGKADAAAGLGVPAAAAEPVRRAAAPFVAWLQVRACGVAAGACAWLRALFVVWLWVRARGGAHGNSDNPRAPSLLRGVGASVHRGTALARTCLFACARGRRRRRAMMMRMTTRATRRGRDCLDACQQAGDGAASLCAHKMGPRGTLSGCRAAAWLE